ncbi:hypothetical protein VTO73DRAFT_7214 [Trametes versicolor]
MLATENATDSGSFEALDPTTYYDPLELLFPLPASATAQDFYGILFPAPNEGSDQVAGGDHIPLPVLDRLSDPAPPSASFQFQGQLSRAAACDFGFDCGSGVAPIQESRDDGWARVRSFPMPISRSGSQRDIGVPFISFGSFATSSCATELSM